MKSEACMHSALLSGSSLWYT